MHFYALLLDFALFSNLMTLNICLMIKTTAKMKIADVVIHFIGQIKLEFCLK